MGRRKIEIQPIDDERNRTVTFVKRKAGLLKKAHELSILCKVDVAVIIVGHNRKIYQYSSDETKNILDKYYDSPTIYEAKAPKDYGQYETKSRVAPPPRPGSRVSHRRTASSTINPLHNANQVKMEPRALQQQPPSPPSEAHESKKRKLSSPSFASPSFGSPSASSSARMPPFSRSGSGSAASPSFNSRRPSAPVRRNLKRPTLSLQIPPDEKPEQSIDASKKTSLTPIGASTRGKIRLPAVAPMMTNFIGQPHYDGQNNDHSNLSTPVSAALQMFNTFSQISPSQLVPSSAVWQQAQQQQQQLLQQQSQVDGQQQQQQQPGQQPQSTLPNPVRSQAAELRVSPQQAPYQPLNSASTMYFAGFGKQRQRPTINTAAAAVASGKVEPGPPSAFTAQLGQYGVSGDTPTLPSGLVSKFGDMFPSPIVYSSNQDWSLPMGSGNTPLPSTTPHLLPLPGTTKSSSTSSSQSKASVSSNSSKPSVSSRLAAASNPVPPQAAVAASQK